MQNDVAPAAAAAYIIQVFSGSSAALQRRPERASPTVRVALLVSRVVYAAMLPCPSSTHSMNIQSTLISNVLLLACVHPCVLPSPQIGSIGFAVASTFVSIAVSAPIYHVVAILLGAPLSSLAAKTGLLAVILSVLTTVPLACDMAISTHAGRREAWYVYIWVLLWLWCV